MFKVDNAIILAAGFGSRFVPVTFEHPKGLIPVKGEPLIERQIRQLKEKGINEIIIVIGYLKEKFDYLIDKFDVKLVYNPEYAVKNNLASLYCVCNYLKNSYILSADNWIEENIFNSIEEKSWYSCVYKDGPTSEWCVKTDDAGRIIGVTIGGYDSWVMYGPVFLTTLFSKYFVSKIIEYYKKPGKENYMWENVFIDELHNFDLYINKQSSDNVYELETLEELRQFDPDYNKYFNNKLIQTIENVFNVKENEIVDIKNLKAGMTNKSFIFTVNNKSYIFRMPGEGTEKLINRNQERKVYEVIKNLHISDKIIHFDENTGCKISIYYNNARNTNAQVKDDVEISMMVMRNIHQSGIYVDHSFDIEKEISRYLLLCDERKAIRFTDNEETYEKMRYLIDLTKKINVKKVLCHVDSNPDNIIRLIDGSIRVIDWEYAGMGDPIMDLSMYSIYSYYSKNEMDELLRIYLQHEPDTHETLRLYIYAALGGYLWALWTEYKQSFGVEFADYGMKMYRYAKEFYNHVISLTTGNGNSK
jgi:CTP:phosphocholine cytidylyltransferase-like protein/thiamine kinase-like enzyme